MATVGRNKAVVDVWPGIHFGRMKIHGIRGALFLTHCWVLLIRTVVQDWCV